MMDEVRALTTDVRNMFERMLEQSDIARTAGTCLHASFVLCSTLQRFGGCKATICGGDGKDDGGLTGPDGQRHGHYWVEGTTANGEAFIADITADQFGLAPVLVLPVAEGRAIYQPGDAELVQFAVEQLEAEF